MHRHSPFLTYCHALHRAGRLQHRIGSLEEQLFAACSPKPAAAALQLSTPTNAPPELLPTSPELSKVELQVEALKAQLHAEEERCTELLKRTLASEAHQEEAQHRVADIESAQKTELSALQASLCQAHVDLKRISVAKAECESSLAQFGAREQQRFKQLDCDLRVCNEKEKAAVQEVRCKWSARRLLVHRLVMLLLSMPAFCL